MRAAAEAAAAVLAAGGTAAAAAAASGAVLGGVIAAGSIAMAGTVAGVVHEAVETDHINKENAAAIAAQQTNNTPTHGEYYANEWNYQEKITTDYNAKTGVCKRCISKRQCEKTKWSLFSKRSCKKWADDEFTDERCTEMKF